MPNRWSRAGSGRCRPLTKFDLWSRYVAKTGRPILIGPWREEIGSETLYWLPWLLEWRKRYGIQKDRLVAISRGGASVWYDASMPVELFDYWPLEVLRLETARSTAKHGSLKQVEMTELERLLYPVIAARLGLRRYHVLHPQAMYQELQGWWLEQMGLKAIIKALRFAPPPVPPLPLGTQLPERFLCVRFYHRYTWPLTDEVRDWCGAVVGQLAKNIPIVVIGSSQHHDDHLDLAFNGPNIVNLMDQFPERENLAFQSAVLAKSSGFVGTYGGLMQLAVRLKKPAAGFFLKWSGTAIGHRILTEWLATAQGTPLFIGTPSEGEFVRSVISQPLEAPMAPGSSSGGGP